MPSLPHVRRSPLLAGATAFTFLLLGLVDPTGAASAAADDTDTDYGRMLLVLDSSGSMAEPASDGGTTKIAAAKDALGSVIADLPDDAYVGLRVYGAKVFSKSQPGACKDSQLVVPPGTDNRDELRSALASYQPYGETPIGYALQQAAQDIGAEGTRSVVLVSDGEATCAPDPCKVAARLGRSGIDLQIDVVGLAVSGKARDQLRCVAAQGNGTYYDADSADEIADSLQTASDRAVRPFELEGTPIEGGPSSLEATPVTPGRWVDKVGVEGASSSERWFSFDRTIAGSTVSFGVSSLGSAGLDTDYIELSAVTEDGTSCGLANDLKQINTAIVLGAGIQVGPETVSSEECLGQRLLVKVSRDFNPGGATPDQEAPYALRVVEEPPATDIASLPAGVSGADSTYEAPQVTGSATEVLGGDSFGSAPEIGNGRVSGSIVPGETQVFRVRLDYGQKLDVRLLTPAMSPALRDEVNFVYGPFADLSVYDPTGARQRRSDGSTSSGFSATAQPEALTLGLPEVRYRNREVPTPAATLPATTTSSMPSTATATELFAAVRAPGPGAGHTERRAGVRRRPDGPRHRGAGDRGARPLTRPCRTDSGSQGTEDETEGAAASDDDGLSTPVKAGFAGALVVVAALCVGDRVAAAATLGQLTGPSRQAEQDERRPRQAGEGEQRAAPDQHPVAAVPRRRRHARREVRTRVGTGGGDVGGGVVGPAATWSNTSTSGPGVPSRSSRSRDLSSLDSRPLGRVVVRGGEQEVHQRGLVGLGTTYLPRLGDRAGRAVHRSPSPGRPCPRRRRPGAGPGPRRRAAPGPGSRATRRSGTRGSGAARRDAPRPRSRRAARGADRCRWRAAARWRA